MTVLAAWSDTERNKIVAQDARRREAEAREDKVLAMVMAGIPLRQIGENIGLCHQTVAVLRDRARHRYSIPPLHRRLSVRARNCLHRHFGRRDWSLDDLRALDLEAFSRAVGAGKQTILEVARLRLEGAGL